MPVKWRFVPTLICSSPGYRVEREQSFLYFWARWVDYYTIMPSDLPKVKEHLQKGTIYVKGR